MGVRGNPSKSIRILKITNCFASSKLSQFANMYSQIALVNKLLLCNKIKTDFFVASQLPKSVKKYSHNAFASQIAFMLILFLQSQD